jgi:hypothetical protein
MLSIDISAESDKTIKKPFKLKRTNWHFSSSDHTTYISASTKSEHEVEGGIHLDLVVIQGTVDI